MRTMTLAEIESPLSARLVAPDARVDTITFNAVSTDSRTLERGDLYLALCGDNFDGHDYLGQVVEKGAVAAVTSIAASANGQINAVLPQLQVADTQEAFGRLGAYNRSLYQGPLVAITGSSGKTTVKNMLHAVLSRGGETLATEGNFNNEIGVPLTLLRLHPGVQFAVVEMGAARAGDIAWLCELGRPTIALLLNAMPAHLQSFGSVEETAQAKGEIFDGLTSADVAVINADQPWAKQWRKRAGDASVLDFGLEQAAAISARDIHVNGVQGVSFTASTPEGDIAIKLGLPGRHNVANALAAIAGGLACNIPITKIRDGLESLQPVAGRLRSLNGHSGATVIDDCYNANPGSVKAAIDMLGACDGRRVLVLGAMLELGEESAELHRDIGRYARQQGIDQLVGVGTELEAAVEAFGADGRYFENRATASPVLAEAFNSGDTVLIKGSRGAGMELLLPFLLDGSRAKEAKSC